MNTEDETDLAEHAQYCVMLFQSVEPEAKPLWNSKAIIMELQGEKSSQACTDEAALA